MIRETLSFMPFSLIFIVPIIIWMIKKKKESSQIILYNIFILYIFGVIAQVCLPIRYSGIHIIENIKNYPYNETIYIIPFKQQYFDIRATNSILMLLKSYALNIILTIPFGILFPLIKRISYQYMIIVSITFGLLAETFQLVIGLFFGWQFRITHIDDVIMNAIGIMIGYALLAIINKYDLLMIASSAKSLIKDN